MTCLNLWTKLYVIFDRGDATDKDNDNNKKNDNDNNNDNDNENDNDNDKTPPATRHRIQ